MTEVISFFNSNKKMPLYIRHSCCIKIPPISSKINPSYTSPPPLFNIIPNSQNPAILYFISLFIVPIKLFQLFILVLLLSHILLHKKRPHLTVCPVPFYSTNFSIITSNKIYNFIPNKFIMVLYYFVTLFLIFRYFFLQFRK